MIKAFIRSIIIGLVAASIIVSVIPSLRQSILSLFTSEKPASVAQPVFSFSEAVKKAAPAVVNIYSRKYDVNNHDQLSTQGLGSGVIVDVSGYIITNYHVIAQADQIIVALQDGRVDTALLVGYDKRTDIAVLKIQVNDLPVIPFDPNYQPQIGDVVLAIGNPYNLGQTTTYGIISATGRFSISTDGRQAMIQTDAAINQGNSGGALVNSLGNIVGINSASFRQATDLATDGISFAIPYPLANKIMRKIIADGRVIRGYIGVDGRDINTISSRLLSGQYAGGIIVLGVAPDSPAEKAGIKAHDIILEIAGKKITGQQSILDLIIDLRPGSVIDVKFSREGAYKTVKVTVGEDTR